MISATVSVLIGSSATNRGQVEQPPEQWLPGRCSSVVAGGPVAELISQKSCFDLAPIGAPIGATGGRIPTLVGGMDC